MPPIQPKTKPPSTKPTTKPSPEKPGSPVPDLTPNPTPSPTPNPGRRLEPGKICPDQKLRIVRRIERELPNGPKEGGLD